jgi:hypothetical protein
MSAASFDYVESLSTQELEFELFRVGLQVRRGTLKASTYRRLLINKLKNVLLSLNMSKEQAGALASRRGKKLGTAYEQNAMSI